MDEEGYEGRDSNKESTVLITLKIDAEAQKAVKKMREIRSFGKQKEVPPSRDDPNSLIVASEVALRPLSKSRGSFRPICGSRLYDTLCIDLTVFMVTLGAPPCGVPQVGG